MLQKSDNGGGLSRNISEWLGQLMRATPCHLDPNTANIFEIYELKEKVENYKTNAESIKHANIIRSRHERGWYVRPYPELLINYVSRLTLSLLTRGLKCT